MDNSAPFAFVSAVDVWGMGVPGMEVDVASEPEPVHLLASNFSLVAQSPIHLHATG